MLTGFTFWSSNGLKENRLPISRLILRLPFMKSTGKYLKTCFYLALIFAVWFFWPQAPKNSSPTLIVNIAPTPTPIENPEDQLYEKHTEELESFFAKYKCSDPDNNIIGNYLEYAWSYGVDWRLLPAISVQESSCGKHQLYNNYWGFGSNTGLKHFKNIFYGMDYIMNALKNPPYFGKTNSQILQIYGPHINGKPSPTYYKQVLKFMDEIEK